MCAVKSLSRDVGFVFLQTGNQSSVCLSFSLMPPLCNFFHVGNRSAHLLQHSTSNLTSCAFSCLATKIHDLHLLTRVHSNISWNILGVSSSIAELMKRSWFCAPAPWCSRVFCCNCTIFLRSSVRPDEKCKQTGRLCKRALGVREG